ncbi:MAG: hypothetical protein ACLT5V_18500, partial [Enterococcus avium]
KKKYWQQKASPTLDIIEPKKAGLNHMIGSCFFKQIFCCFESPTIVGKEQIDNRQSVAYL